MGGLFLGARHSQHSAAATQAAARHSGQRFSFILAVGSLAGPAGPTAQRGRPVVASQGVAMTRGWKRRRYAMIAAAFAEDLP